MITHLNGRLIEKNPTHAIVECAGVGYFVHISLNSYAQIQDQESIKIYTHYSVREDAHTLFGFATESERIMFRLLISVSGIGPSTAILILSSLGPQQLKEAILSEEVSLLKTIKGIGGKTAQRMVVELKDKMEKDTQIQLTISGQQSETKKEALAALQVLGFDRKRVEKPLEAILKKSDPEIRVEEVIKLVLKSL
jgi:Holliday junction DNA helicase RuvA